MQDNKEKLFQIVLNTGETYNTYHKSKDALLKWLNTGVAGFLPHGKEQMVHLTPTSIKEIIEFED